MSTTPPQQKIFRKLPQIAQLTVFALDIFFFFSSRRRHTRCSRDWSSDVLLFRSRRRLRFRGIRWRRQQFTKELNRGAEQVTAADGESFAAGTAFGGSLGYGEFTLPAETHVRSEEGRVGEEGRSRGSPDHLKKKKK